MARRYLWWSLLMVSLCVLSRARAQPADARFEGIEQLVEQAIARGELPGCTIDIGTHEGSLYARAFGERTAGEPMMIDTLFDLASLTKPLATALSVAALVERGQLDLDQPVARHLPPFARADKRAITPRQLLLHTSGLPSVGPLADFESGRERALARIAGAKLTAAPGKLFRYSDLGYIVLGELVAALSGRPLERFVEEALYAPLGSSSIGFGVAPPDVPRAAPTEQRDGATIRGVVDDPRAFRLGGVAGHAGLFATAADVARVARMLLGGGSAEGRRVLRAETVATFTRPARAGEAQRTLGFDVQSTYAVGRGRLLGDRAYGHGGYTGTSVWIDPAADLYVVVLSNRVHSGARGTIHPLASSIADIAASARSPRADGYAAGIDVLAREAYARLRGRKIALLTHLAARDAKGSTTLELLAREPTLTLLSVLAPEHGLTAKAEGHVANAKRDGIPVHSLFGRTRRPSPAMLAGADMIVVDLVDVGTRFYTYMATVLATLEVAAELDLPVVLLDRANPIGGTRVEGPISQPAYASFVNYHPLPLRHGMTAGELARLLVRERELRVRLSVVRAEGWRRGSWIGERGTRWDPPSPNLKSPEQALLYPAVALIEGTNLSVGRGTERAFRVVGAPFVAAEALTRALREARLPGVRVAPTRFRPTVGPHRGRSIPGVQLSIVDAQTYSAARTGLALIRALRATSAAGWERERLDRMVAHAETLRLLEADTSLAQIEATWSAELTAFAARRRAVLLY